MRKYRNRITWCDGIRFSSEAEANRYQQLKLLERGNRISSLKLQVAFELAPAVQINGRKKPALRYVADFTYIENDRLVVEDVKGVVTQVYAVKRHLMKSVHGINIREVK